MSKQRSRILSMIGTFWIIVLLCSALPGAVIAADDQERDDRDDATLVGSWRESIVFPGVPIEFFDLITFNKDGTLIEQFGDGPAFSTSIGVWKRVGRRTFAATYETFSDTDGDGRFDVRFRIRLTYHLVDRDTLTATATGDTLSVDGTTQLGPSFPFTIQGTRMDVIRE